MRVHDNYPEVDLVVTENGMACKDQLTVNEDGTKSVHDPDRIDYLKRHFAAAKRAIDEGVPLTGYFVWSLLDNFEWYFGYAKRFGITYVDYATQERIPKDSFMWYRDFLASAGAERPAIAVARCSMNACRVHSWRGTPFSLRFRRFSLLQDFAYVCLSA